MHPNSKPLLLNSRAGIATARKTLAPIDSEAIKNKSLIQGASGEDVFAEADAAYG